MAPSDGSVASGAHDSAAPSPAIVALANSLPKEKWLLASLMQKAIRRGKSNLAAASAIVLDQVEPGYVLRRLPVIAYEDVGVANATLLIDVIAEARNLRTTSLEHRQRRVAVLASLLAASTKSRTACDVLSLMSAARVLMANRSNRPWVPPLDLAALAEDRNAPLLDRATAFDQLFAASAVSARNRGAEANVALLFKVASAMAVPEVVVSAARCGTGTHRLNRFLPLAYEVVFANGAVHQGEARPSRWGAEASGPILLCALDMYTRLGQSAYRRLLRTEGDLAELLRSVPTVRNAVHAIGTLLFHAEGSILDRPVTSSTSQALLQEVELAEERVLGFPSRDAARAVREWLMSHGDRVAAARLATMAAALDPAGTTGNSSESRSIGNGRAGP
jgi:hypothetical protein